MRVPDPISFHPIDASEVRNERALAVYNRVQHKLTGTSTIPMPSHAAKTTRYLGRDFDPEVSLSVQQQVDKLILTATSLENLCQCFSGWCAQFSLSISIVLTMSSGVRSGRCNICFEDSLF